jgi:lipopolysaccharide/colanic/teichoic acid biosynthesis glycosyltransferase
MFLKRLFDLIASFFCLFFFSWLIILCWIIAAIETRSNGFYFQKRVGRFGTLFWIIKIKTMFDGKSSGVTVTLSNDPRISKSGAFFRKYKLDELPQLFNVLVGHMSFVGPRPDVPGYADILHPSVRNVLLSVRPGITGPATLEYRCEEALLSTMNDPKKYNDTVIFPHKVLLNLEYISNWSFKTDISLILKTILN